MRQGPLVTAAQWVVLALAWLVFSGSVKPPELIVGAFVAAIGVAALRAVELHKFARVAMLPRAFAQAWRLPKLVIVGTWEILVVLYRQIFRHRPAGSLLLATPYSAVGAEDRAATRRALATMYTTIAPNFIVVEVDRAHGLLVFHQLDESETPKMTRNLGAEA